jgi:hypothetical protein
MLNQKIKILLEKQEISTIFKVDPIIIASNKLPEYLNCGKKCKHLSSDNNQCYLFKSNLNKDEYGQLRSKNCLSFIEGIT